MTEPAGATPTCFKILDDLEVCLHDGDEHHLRESRARLDIERLVAPIPRRHEYLPLVVRIDQSHEIAQHDAVFMPQARARQYMTAASDGSSI